MKAVVYEHYDSPDKLELKEVLESGKIKTVIDRSYSLSDLADAIRYLEEGHARGKVLISL